MAVKKTAREIRIEELVKALKKGAKDAVAYRNYPDGGACNIDNCILYTEPRKFYEKDMEEVSRRSGVQVIKWGPGKWCVCGPSSGMGDRRTKMAEAMADSLRKSGYDTMVEYWID